MKRNMSRHIRLKHPKTYKQMYHFLETKNMPKNMRRRSTSWVKGSWAKKYCQRLGGNKYQCNLCEAVLSLAHGLFGNMKRHIKSKHPYVYEKELSGDASDVDDNIIPGDESDAQYLTEFLKDESEKDNSDDENNADSDSDGDSNVTEGFLKESDPDFVCKVQYLVTKPVSGKKRAKNCIWNFFNVIEENHLYSCLACNKRVAIFPHSIANLKRHIKMRHKKQFAIMIEHMSESGKKSPISFDKYYFDLEGDNEYRCKDCGEITVCNEEDQQSLFDHIKDNHPDQILAYQEEAMDDEDLHTIIVNKDEL